MNVLPKQCLKLTVKFFELHCFRKYRKPVYIGESISVLLIVLFSNEGSTRRSSKMLCANCPDSSSAYFLNTFCHTLGDFWCAKVLKFA